MRSNKIINRPIAINVDETQSITEEGQLPTS